MEQQIGEINRDIIKVETRTHQERDQWGGRREVGLIGQIRDVKFEIGEGTSPYIIEEMNSSSFNEGSGPGGVKEDTRETRRRREVVTLMRRTTG